MEDLDACGGSFPLADVEDDGGGLFPFTDVGAVPGKPRCRSLSPETIARIEASKQRSAARRQRNAAKQRQQWSCTGTADSGSSPAVNIPLASTNTARATASRPTILPRYKGFRKWTLAAPAGATAGAKRWSLPPSAKASGVASNIASDGHMTQAPVRCSVPEVRVLRNKDTGRQRLQFKWDSPDLTTAAFAIECVGVGIGTCNDEDQDDEQGQDDRKAPCQGQGDQHQDEGGGKDEGPGEHRQRPGISHICCTVPVASRDYCCAVGKWTVPLDWDGGCGGNDDDDNGSGDSCPSFVLPASTPALVLAVRGVGTNGHSTRRVPVPTSTSLSCCIVCTILLPAGVESGHLDACCRAYAEAMGTGAEAVVEAKAEAEIQSSNSSRVDKVAQAGNTVEIHQQALPGALGPALLVPSLSPAPAVASLLERNAGALRDLVHLDIGYCTLGPDGVKAVLTALRGHVPPDATSSAMSCGCALESLVLNNTDAGPHGTAALAAAMAAGAFPRLLSLDVRYNHAGPAAIAALSCALGACPMLQLLYLTGNRAGEAGVGALATALSGGAGRSLCTLDLHDNRAGEGGVIAFADAIVSGACPELRSLFLQGNRAGPHATSLLLLRAPALAQLEELYVSGNQGGLECACALERAARGGGLSRLQAFHITRSKIDTEGFQVIARALRTGGLAQVKSLYVNGNTGGDEGVCAIFDALTGCPELEVLNVYENGISDATLSHMTSVVRAGMCECLRELVAVRNRQEISEAAVAAFIAAHPHIKLK